MKLLKLHVSKIEYLTVMLTRHQSIFYCHIRTEWLFIVTVLADSMMNICCALSVASKYLQTLFNQWVN